MVIDKLLLILPRLHTNTYGWIEVFLTKYKVYAVETSKSRIKSSGVRGLHRLRLESSNYKGSIFRVVRDCKVLAEATKKIDAGIVLIRPDRKLFSLLYVVWALAKSKDVVVYQQIHRWACPPYSNSFIQILKRIECQFYYLITGRPVISPCLCISESRRKLNRGPGYWTFFPFRPVSIVKQESLGVDILIVAKIKKRKRVYEFISAWSDYKQEGLRIVLCSQVENAEDYIEIEKLRLLAARCELELDIQLDRSHEDVLALMNRARLVVLPSIKEPASVSVVEALAAGAVVVCSDQCGTSGYGSLGVNLIAFSEIDPNTVIDAVRRAFEISDVFDRDERRSCYKRHMKRLVKRYSQETEIFAASL